MCLAVPGELIRIENDPAGLPMGVVSFGGVRKQVCLAYVPEAEVGEYVLVHVGFALNTIDEDEAKQVFAALREMDELGEIENDANAPGDPT